MKRTAAIFLDRDNTLTVDQGYSYEIEKFRWIKGAPLALKAFHEAAIPVFIVTNQGGIGRGFFSLDDMHKFNRHLQEMTKNAGGKITDIAYCPHHPLAITDALKSPCPCRKPEPGLFFKLAEKWRIDLMRSVMIGDRPSDVEAGRRAGCHSYLFNGGSLYDLGLQVIKAHFEVNGR